MGKALENPWENMVIFVLMIKNQLKHDERYGDVWLIDETFVFSWKKTLKMVFFFIGETFLDEPKYLGFSEVGQHHLHSGQHSLTDLQKNAET